MPTGCSYLIARLVVSFLAICVEGIPSAVAQTNGETRPRSIVSYKEARSADETKLEVGSPQARAEAKKLYKAGVDYVDAGLFTQAAELFRRAIRLDPEYAEAYRGLGRTYADMGDWGKAVESLQQAV